MIVIILAAGAELLLFGWLEYFLVSRQYWWKLSALLPFLGMALFWKWREAVWFALSQEDRSRFGITRFLEQWVIFLGITGLIAGLIFALGRASGKKQQSGNLHIGQEEENP